MIWILRRFSIWKIADMFLREMSLRALFQLVAVFCFAVAACVGLNRENAVFPCFGWFRVFFFTVWTFAHTNHI
jgi:hypothetical protein